MNIKPFSIAKSKIERIKERFMRFVKVDKGTGCWLWQGYICKRGYPRFWIAGGSPSLANRVSYALFKGPIKRDKVIDHRCNNTRCVNPEHIQQTSQSNNIKAIHRRNTGTLLAKGEK